MKANSSHFSGIFSHLNKTDLNINISRLGLARCVSMAGCGSWGNFYDRGFFRLTQLASMVMANTQGAKSTLALAPSFHLLDPSEKNPISYHLGTGLTKAFAEQHLKVPWLSHISDYKSKIVWQGSPVVSKQLLFTPPKNKNAKEPDLIGYDRDQRPHVLESKGNSNGFVGAILQHGINQVSQVATVAGKVPRTRVACFQDLSKVPFVGRIVDPEGETDGGCTIEWTIEECIETYYSAFSNLLKSGRGKYLTLESRRFLVWRPRHSRISFGMDEYLLGGLANGVDRFLGRFKETSAEFVNRDRVANEYGGEYNIGIDGVIIIAR